MTLSKKIFGTVLKIIIVLIASLAVFLLVCFVIYSVRELKKYNAAMDYFHKVCEYVKETRDVHNEFFEYQVSLLNDDKTFFTIEHSGEYQEQRDIVLKYAHWADAGYSGTIEGLGIVSYGNSHSGYEIIVRYGKNIVNECDLESTKECCVIDDNIYIYIQKNVYC